MCSRRVRLFNQKERQVTKKIYNTNARPAHTFHLISNGIWKIHWYFFSVCRNLLGWIWGLAVVDAAVIWGQKMAHCFTFIRSAHSSIPIYFKTGWMSIVVWVDLHKNKSEEFLLNRARLWLGILCHSATLVKMYKCGDSK